MVNNGCPNDQSILDSMISILCNYRLDRPTLRAPNLEIDNQDTHAMMTSLDTNDFMSKWYVNLLIKDVIFQMSINNDTMR
jgi:hypothetical protein